MKAILTLVALTHMYSSLAQADTEECKCKCVTKESDESYSTAHGAGKDREAAGENLKKKLGKKKCELTPICSGTC